jgi:hypothetical protein
MKPNYTILVFFLFISISNTAFSQKVLLSEKTNTLFEKKNDYGPGLKNFHHLYLGYGLMLDNPNFQNVRLVAWRSNSVNAGWRVQHNIFRFYGLGTDIYYNYTDFSIKQIPGKTFPDVDLHQKERLVFHNVGAEVYQRITVFRRGNLMGLFIDAGAFINYSFLTKYIEKDKFDAYTDNAKIKVVTYRGLNYVNDFHYGWHFRLGYNRWAIAASYRISPLLKNTDALLPPIWFQLQLGLHK